MRRFRASDVAYRPSTEVWQVEPGFAVFLKSKAGLEKLEARRLIIACGAMERPMPFPGWTLPGITTVGAGQIMLKSAKQIPDGPVWLAGTGPLMLLYAAQLLKAGGRIAGMLDTATSKRWPNFTAALQDAPGLFRGLAWLLRIRLARIPIYSGVTQLVAEGSGALSHIRFHDRTGKDRRVEATSLMVHDGVVPRSHIPAAIGCKTEWQGRGRYFSPVLDQWRQSSVPGLYVAGDASGIAGAEAACVSGEIAGLGAIASLRGQDVEAERARLERRWKRIGALRPFLEERYPPLATPLPDQTIVCRCENVSAGELRAAIADGATGSNQLKSYTRCGMGPCQGRQCGYSVLRVLAEARSTPCTPHDLFRVRPPYRPVTLGQLAAAGLQQGTADE